MNRKICSALICCACFFASASSAAPESKLEKLMWVLGTWKRETPRSITYETWRKLSDKTIEGESYRLAKPSQQKVFAESLLLVEMGGEIFYTAKVAENKYPIPFKLISIETGKAVFENPEHDFPQKITYQLNGDGSLTVLTEGDMNGERKRIDFHFTKVDAPPSER